MHWFNYINTGLLIAIWTVIFFDLKKYSSGRVFWLFFLAVYSLTEFISLPLEIKGINNLWLYNISKPVQFFCLIVYFTRQLIYEKRKRLVIQLLSVLLCFIFFYTSKLSNYNSLSDIIFSCIILIFCAAGLYKIIKKDEYIPLGLSEFWVYASLFVFFGINLCISGALNFLLEKHFDLARKLFYILVINSIVFYFLTIFTLYSIRKNYLIKQNGR